MRKRAARGVATVEAVVMLPLFVVLLLGTRWVVHRHTEELVTTARARECAWRTAMNGCDEIPTECRGLVDVATPVDAAGELLSGRVRRQLSEGNPLAGLLLGVPVLGEGIRALLPREASAVVRMEVKKPELFGKGAVELAAKLSVSCNEIPASGGPAQAVLRAVAPSVF